MPRASSKALGLHVGEFISCKQLIASNAQKKKQRATTPLRRTFRFGAHWRPFVGGFLFSPFGLNVPYLLYGDSVPLSQLWDFSS
jgi:hypothetical protein